MLSISWTTAEEGVFFPEDPEGENGVSEEGIAELVFTENVLQFDCVTSETHEGISELTEHAVETGAPISDHKREKPRRLTIEALVTNTPLAAPPPSGYDDGTRVTAEVQAEGEDAAGEGQQARAQVVVFSAPFDRMGDVFETLDRLRRDAVFVTITTRVRTYESVQIVSVTAPREAEDGDSLRFGIECQEVRIAETRSIDTPAPREPRGGTPRERGAREGTEETERSTLAAARDEYETRRAAGDSRTDAAMGTLGALFGGG